MNIRSVLGDAKIILKTSRPFNWLSTAVPFAVGYLLASGRLDTTLLVGTIYFLLPFNLALYGMNDIFDQQLGKVSPHKKSTVPQGKHKLVWWSIAATNLTLLALLLASSPTSARIALAAMCLLCVSYSMKGFRLKEIPFIDALCAAGLLVSPAVIGLLMGQSQSLYIPALASLFYWGMASHTLGTIQSLIPDRNAKIRSIATFLGARRANTLSLCLYLLAASLPVIFYWGFGLPVGLLLSFYVLNVAFFRKYRSDAQSHHYRRSWYNFSWLNWLVGFWTVQVLLFVADPLKLGAGRFDVLALVLISIGLAQLALAIYNLIHLRRPKTQRTSEWPRVSIVIHALDRADNINSTLLAALGQSYPEFDVIFADLGSSDNTLKLASGFQDDRLTIVDLPDAPNNWQIGSWATAQLCEQATGEIVVSLPADTVLLPNALSTIVGQMQAQDLQLVSLLPADQNKTLAQKLVLNQNQFMLLGSYPAAYFEKYHSDINLAYGGLIGFDKQAIMAIKGFEKVRKSPIEEMELAKQAHLHGLTTGFYLASDIAISQNHADLRMIVRDNLVRYYPTLHFNMPLSMSALSFGAVVFVTPGIGLVYSLLLNPTSMPIWTLAFVAGLLPRLAVAFKSKQGVLGPVLYPITSVATLATLFVSMIDYELLKPRWQERTEISLYER